MAYYRCAKWAFAYCGKFSKRSEAATSDLFLFKIGKKITSENGVRSRLGKVLLREVSERGKTSKKIRKLKLISENAIPVCF